MRLVALAASVVFFFRFTALTQQQPAPKSGIEGIVLRGGAGQPVSGARVTLTRQASGMAAPPAGELSTAPSTVTDESGKFVFQNLDEGAYALQVQANGYVQQNYGQRYAGGPGTSITLAAGRQLKDISVSLTPAGNISGRIRDTSGQPLVDIPVQLLRYSYNADGQRVLQPAGAVRTDDRGEYRIYWVTPGRYYVMAGRPRTEANAVLQMLGAVIGGGNGNVTPMAVGYAYYPGVIDIGDARPLDLEPGAELQAVDITLAARPRTYRVRGRVIDSRTGQAPLHAVVAASPKTPVLNTFGISGSFNELASLHYNGATGTFEIRDLLPGAYVVAATAQDQSGSPAAPAPSVASSGSVSIVISDSDVEGLAIRLAPSATIPGRLRFEGQQPRINSTFLPLQLVATNSADAPQGLRFSANPQADPDGTASFRVNNVVPGEYWVALISGFGNSYIKEARFEGVDVLNTPLRFSGSVSGTLDIVLASGGGQLSGMVLDGRSQPAPVTRVVLIPDRARDRADLYKLATTGENGRFTMTGIPPGEYKVFSWEALEQNAWFDPDVMAQSETYGRAVHVTESSAETVELKLIPAGGIR